MAACSCAWGLDSTRVTSDHSHDGSILYPAPTYLQEAEIYDPETNTWMHAPPVQGPVLGLTGHSQSTLPDGQVIVIGCDEWRSYEDRKRGDGAHVLAMPFNPGSLKWRVQEKPNKAVNLAKLSPSTQSCEREKERMVGSRHSQSTLADGQVLVCCALDSKEQDHTQKATLYDIASGKWIPATPMHAARTQHSQSTLADGRRVLVCGGLYNGNTTEIFDPKSNAWSNEMPMLSHRRVHSQSTLLDGRVLVCGGIMCGKSEAVSTAEMWVDAAPMAGYSAAGTASASAAAPMVQWKQEWRDPPPTSKKLAIDRSEILLLRRWVAHAVSLCENAKLDVAEGEATITRQYEADIARASAQRR
jgi:hypothetical protein